MVCLAWRGKIRPQAILGGRPVQAGICRLAQARGEIENLQVENLRKKGR